MNTFWSFRVSLNHLQRVGDLRSLSGVLAAIVGDMFWLRGAGLDAELHRLLAPIADGPVFELASDGRLTPFGAAVPIERLPEADWKPLSDILTPILPLSQMTAVQVPRLRLTLERTTSEQDATLLVTEWTSFSNWALTAPEVRLRSCRFAVCRESLAEFGSSSGPRHQVGGPRHRVAIMGQLLPPLVGARFWLTGSIAIPLGFHWVPRVDAKTVEAVFAKATEDSAPKIRLWHAEQHLVEEIVTSDWVPLTRANVRATEAGAIAVSS